nr:MAG: hypothetical protein DIU57_14250 [Pseudomonadota bacterium]
MIGRCAHCGEPFKRHGKAPRLSAIGRGKYCSKACDQLRRRKVDAERLRQLAFSGATKAEIARELGLGYSTVWRAMRSLNLDDMWKEQRYA